MIQSYSLVGKVFGRWKVLEYGGNSKWLCECQCKDKTRKLVAEKSLKLGTSKSCGCLRRELNSDSKLKNLSGMMFGYWEVIEYSGKSMWKCRCTCGCNTIRDVNGQSLKNGKSQSCGLKTTGFKDLTDEIFGKWKVKRYLGDQMWECECQCAKHTVRAVSARNLLSGASKSCGCSNKLKNLIDISEQTFGELTALEYIGNGLWKCQCSCGNITLEVGEHLRRSTTISCGCKGSRPVKEEDIVREIDTFISEYNRKPYRNEICERVNIGKTTLARCIDRYNLADKFNSTFRSMHERTMFEHIEHSGIKLISNDRKIMQGYELDIYIPEKRVAIEINGDYWHSSLFKDKKYHQNKTIECAKNGIRLIHVFEHELNDENTSYKLYNLIDRVLGICDKQVIYGRSTYIKNIEVDEARNFCDKYHLQGYTSSSINLGCYYNNKLVGIMTFGTPRFNGNYEYEINRLCWCDELTVIGGTEKMFKYFLKKYNPSSVLTYCDISKFTGNIYTKLGFKALEITEPNYKWIKPYNNLVLSRYQTQKHKLVKAGIGTEDETEDEIMTRLGFYKIHDSGNLRLEWKRQ